ncbi:MAG TPA: hypothetical protein VF789_15220 [Thermoanaerobaculia bacterium]
MQALIANRTRPALTCRAELVEIQGREVLAIEVPVSRTPVGTTEGLYLRRALGGRGTPECLPYHFHEMQAQQADRGSLDYSALSVPEAKWEDLDPLEFERFRRSVRENRSLGDGALLDLPDTELAKALGAVAANHEVSAVRVLGLLLFGREEALRKFLPTHEVAFQVFSGLEVEVNEFLRWPLLRVMEELLSRFRARNREAEVMVGLLRRAYHLSASAYRKLGEKAAYVRQRGFESIQQDQMVLQYVQTHGSISRSEAADLCRITEPQAYRLLRRLVEHGLLKSSGGRGRSTRYDSADEP